MLVYISIYNIYSVAVDSRGHMCGCKMLTCLVYHRGAVGHVHAAEHLQPRLVVQGGRHVGQAVRDAQEACERLKAAMKRPSDRLKRPHFMRCYHGFTTFYP